MEMTIRSLKICKRGKVRFGEGYSSPGLNQVEMLWKALKLAVHILQLNLFLYNTDQIFPRQFGCSTRRPYLILKINFVHLSLRNK